jgi:hypothetical protein
MKKFLLGLALASSVFAVPAHAAQVTPGSAGVTIDPFDSTSRGDLIAFSETSGTALTFAATFRSAVYRNTGGTLDFYYQVVRTGAGEISSQEITSFTVAEYTGWDVFAFRDGADFDGPNGFIAANNPGPGGFTSTAERGNNGAVVTIDFGLNGLLDTENSTTYILRTNATNFQQGTFGVIDGSTLQGLTFAPQVPEPATWAMMISGFGLLGAMARRSRRVAVSYA